MDPAALYNPTICSDPTRHFSTIGPIVRSRDGLYRLAVAGTGKQSNDTENDTEQNDTERTDKQSNDTGGSFLNQDHDARTR